MVSNLDLYCSLDFSIPCSTSSSSICQKLDCHKLDCNINTDHPVAFVVSFCVSCVHHWVRDVKGSLGDMRKYQHIDAVRFRLIFLLPSKLYEPYFSFFYHLRMVVA